VNEPSNLIRIIPAQGQGLRVLALCRTTRLEHPGDDLEMILKDPKSDRRIREPLPVA
jgi:hypothetical protein